ncbi:MAG TPA: MFS transporter [Thermoanaerobaculia bacterium]
MAMEEDPETSATEPPDGGVPEASAKWVLAATILGSSMGFIDGTAVNVALPALQADFGATVSDVQWVVEAYALLLASLILVGGALGDHFGRRRAFSAGVVLFAVASAVCGLAPTVLALIAARAVQGVGAALMVPGSLAILSAAFPGERRGRAIGTWSALGAITTAGGPLLGGWLVDPASWRWVFFLNLPLAVAVLLIARRHVPESRDAEAAAGLDFAGSLLATLGLGAVTYALLSAPGAGFAEPRVWATFTLGVLALAGFVVVVARGRSPMMPLALFRSRKFAGANLLTLWLYAALGGTLFFLPFALIQVHGYRATEAGAVFLPFVVLMSTLSRWAGGLVARHGARLPLVLGPTLAAVGFALFARPGLGGSYWTTFFPAIVVLGLGMSLTVAPLTTAVMSAVPVHQSGIASGVNNAVSRVAGLLAIAVFGLVVAAAFDRGAERRLAPLPLPPEARHALAAERSKLAGAAIPPALDAGLREKVKTAIDEAFVDGFRAISWICCGLALLSAGVAAVTIEGRASGRSAG